jgi:DUF4097 and DUF4098 domain-containing protein YvlB
MEGGREKATTQWTRTYSLSGADMGIEVVNTNGAIDVEAVDGTHVSVSAELSARGRTQEEARELLGQIQIAEESGPASVRLETRYPRSLGRSAPEVRYTVRVPRLARVNLHTVNGAISIQGVQGGVKAETTNGAIEGREIGASVVASTINGPIDMRMASLGRRGVSLETTNGAISLALPDQAKGTLIARSVNGAINVSGLSFDRTGPSSRRRLEGRINGGGPDLRLETVNGGITVGRS